MEPQNQSLPKRPTSSIYKILAIILGLIIVLFIAFFALNSYIRHQELNGGSQRPTACTLEAKICPDGSTVSREGPNCEFKECPGS